MYLFDAHPWLGAFHILSHLLSCVYFPSCSLLLLFFWHKREEVTRPLQTLLQAVLIPRKGNRRYYRQYRPHAGATTNDARVEHTALGRIEGTRPQGEPWFLNSKFLTLLGIEVGTSQFRATCSDRAGESPRSPALYSLQQPL